MRRITVSGATGHSRRVLRAYLLLFTLTALFATATPAATAADGPDTDRAAYLAQQLRRSPVYISDQVPREVPRSMAPRFAAEAKRTGVPTYVLLLPYSSAGDEEALLDAVHDRLGRDGLYVLLDESSVSEATAYGVKVPADDAARAAFYELPYDAGALLSFRRFTEVVTLDPARAAERAEAASEKYGSDGSGPEDMYISHTDRDNQSFLTGLLLGGVPASILLLAPFVRRWRRRLPGAAAAGKQAGGRRTAALITCGAALAGAALVAGTATLLFDETRTSGAPAPNVADRSARVERVAAGLRQDPVYTDPESPRVLDDRERSRLHDRIRAFSRSEGGGPVYVAVVPTLSEDESEGDPELFAAAVHHRVGKDGVYVVADPLGGTVDVFNHGLRLDSWRLYLDLPDAIALGDDAANEADDHDLGRRLDALMTFLDRSPRTDAPESMSDPAPASDPRKETTLDPLFSGDFWPGLILGGLAGLLLFCLVAPVLLLVRKVLLRRNPEPLPTEVLPYVHPAAPTDADLRLAASLEARWLERAFATTDGSAATGGSAIGDGPAARDGSAATDGEEPPDDLARECRDAARALLQGDPDRLPDATPADLVAFIVLARVARWSVEGEPVERVCGVNPLHGPAVNRRHVRVSARANARRMLPVCPLCLDAATEAGAIARLVLTLPGPAAPVPYFEADGPLPAVSEGVAALARRVREPSAAS